MDKIIYKGIVFYKPDFIEASRNRGRTLRAISCGRIKRQPCEICGHPDTVAHHEKYEEFLNVRWLCYGDHKIIHYTFDWVDVIENTLVEYKNLIAINPRMKESSQEWGNHLEKLLNEYKVSENMRPKTISRKKVGNIHSVFAGILETVNPHPFEEICGHDYKVYDGDLSGYVKCGESKDRVYFMLKTI